MSLFMEYGSNDKLSLVAAGFLASIQQPGQQPLLPSIGLFVLLHFFHSIEDLMVLLSSTVSAVTNLRFNKQ